MGFLFPSFRAFDKGCVGGGLTERVAGNATSSPLASRSLNRSRGRVPVSLANVELEAVNEDVLPVTVVVPSWRRPLWLGQCLTRLLTLRPSPDRILVVGRPDDVATIEVVREHGGAIDWAGVDRPGYVAPLRAALRAVTTPYLAVIDDDAEPLNDDWLAQLFAPIIGDDVACVGGRVVEASRPSEHTRSSAGKLSWFGRIGGGTGRRTDTGPVDLCALPEGNWLWRVDVLKSLQIPSIFDEGDASMYGCEMCLQANRRGWRTTYTSAAPVLHHSAPRAVGSTSRDDRAIGAYGYTRNMTYIALNHFGWRRPFFLVWSTVIGDSAYLGLMSAVREWARRRLTAGVLVASAAGRAAGLRYWINERLSLLKSVHPRQDRPELAEDKHS